jgi:ketosteroid isomerase-like protein
MTARTQDGREIVQSVLSVAVLRRQADGSWKVIDNRTVRGG